MKIVFDESFYKRLAKIKEKLVLEKVKKAILQVEAVEKIDQIPNLKKMEGFKSFYRIRIGDYRIGIELKQDTLWFITIAHRKDIYKNFP